MSQSTELTSEVLSAILKSIDEGIHVVDTDGITIFYNEVAGRHDGMAVKEVLGKPLLKAFPSLTGETSTLLKVIKTGKPIYNQTQVYVNAHGRRIDTINTTLPLLLEKRVIGAVEIAKDYSRIKLLANRLLELQKGLNDGRGKQGGSYTKYTLSDLKTVNPKFAKMKAEAKKLAKSVSPILVYGESGTGKELFVQGIHQESMRANGPFIAQNCAAIPESLLESILFGTAKGSYTGAVERKGLFELANGGTLFLDELNSMPIELQAKLLRVLEEGMVRRVGGGESIFVDVRVIAAMNEHPEKVLQYGKLRHDLYYRLNVFMFALMPLRERKEDIMLLTEYFRQSFNEMLNKNIQGFDEKLKQFFLSYAWPGNVRELKHAMEYMMHLGEHAHLTITDLPPMLKQKAVHTPTLMEKSCSLKANLAAVEKDLIEKAIAQSNGNINQAAKLLEVPRQTLQYKLKKYQ
ncbi:sigma-54 interaction domain-containing protein [Neobacillus sp. SM06]|uniref:sigma-54 interaction domain-containing protein n=1 Tax=Neobacillus sp. SM06 TaxID=3422492 RepID=UPI003D282B56